MKKSELKAIIKEEATNKIVGFDELNFEEHAPERFGRKEMSVDKDGNAARVINSQYTLDQHKAYLMDRFGKVDFEEWDTGRFKIVPGNNKFDRLKAATDAALKDYYSKPGYKGD